VELRLLQREHEKTLKKEEIEGFTSDQEEEMN